MTNPDAEIESWRAAWTSSAEVPSSAPAESRRKAVQQQRSLRMQHVAELTMAVVFLVFSAVVVWKRPGVESYLWAAVVWAGTIVATAFSLWNWRSLWTADLKSVAEFTEHYRKRCLAGLRAVRFGRAFLVVQIAITVPWLTADYLRRQISGISFALAMLVLALFTVGFVLFFAHVQRRNSLELKELSTMDKLD
jgi:cation transport ATPase